MARRRWNLDIVDQIMKGNNPFIQVGYTPASRKRKGGETWTDSKGKKWQQKDGRKVQLSSTETPLLDALNALSKCSDCGTNIRTYGNRLDHKVFPKTGKCYDCLEQEELIYRTNGKWESYEKMKLLKNKRSQLKNFKEKVLEAIEFLKNESGKIRESLPDGTEITFTGKSNPQWLPDAEADLVKVEFSLEEINKEIELFELELSK